LAIANTPQPEQTTSCGTVYHR